jgi:hypothetical protein
VTFEWGLSGDPALGLPMLECLMFQDVEILLLIDNHTVSLDYYERFEELCENPLVHTTILCNLAIGNVATGVQHNISKAASTYRFVPRVSRTIMAISKEHTLLTMASANT